MTRVGLLLIALAVAGVIVLILLGPMPQDPAYHDFADRRELVGVPNALDTLSNLPFTVVGLIGVAWVLRRTAFRTSAERHAALTFFAFVALVGPGSAWYHLDPTNDSLLWDRIPIAAATMALLSLVLAERLGPRIGGRLLVPLVLFGLASAVYWGITDDLRPYGLAQFYPVAAILLLVGLTKAPYTLASGYFVTVGFYAMAKVTEVSDVPIYEATGFLAGHTLKHLFAAGGAAWLLRMMHRRQPIG